MKRHLVTSRRRALTYFEVVVSLAILATASAASLQALGSFALGSRLWRERATAQELASQLQEEIETLPWADPAGGATIGIEVGEASGNRTTFDDIDDFDGWTEPSIQDRAGASLPGYGGYSRSVTVAYANDISSATTPALPTNTFKKITVTVWKNGKQLARLTAIRGAHNEY